MNHHRNKVSLGAVDDSYRSGQTPDLHTVYLSQKYLRTFRPVVVLPLIILWGNLSPLAHGVVST